MFAEEFLPVYDVSDEVATVVAAGPHAVWEALLDADLIEVGKRTPLAGLLGAAWEARRHRRSSGDHGTRGGSSPGRGHSVAGRVRRARWSSCRVAFSPGCLLSRALTRW